MEKKKKEKEEHRQRSIKGIEEKEKLDSQDSDGMYVLRIDLFPLLFIPRHKKKQNLKYHLIGKINWVFCVIYEVTNHSTACANCMIMQAYYVEFACASL